MRREARDGFSVNRRWTILILGFLACADRRGRSTARPVTTVERRYRYLRRSCDSGTGTATCCSGRPNSPETPVWTAVCCANSASGSGTESPTATGRAIWNSCCIPWNRRRPFRRTCAQMTRRFRPSVPSVLVENNNHEIKLYTCCPLFL